MFYAGTGLKLGEFIQRRKMEYAYYLLAELKMSVLDTSLSVGYESVAAFSRAFSQLYLLEPSEVKRGKIQKVTLPRLIKSSKRPSLLPDILELPARRLIGLYGNGFKGQSYFSIAQILYEKLHTSLNLKEDFDFSQQKLIGVALESPWRGEQDNSTFFAGVQLDTELINEVFEGSDLTEYICPAGCWARFEHRGPYNTMWQTILSIYANWVIPNNRQLKDSAIVQHYLNSVTTTPPNELKTHIYIPIVDE